MPQENVRLVERAIAAICEAVRSCRLSPVALNPATLAAHPIAIPRR
jgi:hypothetical protein